MEAEQITRRLPGRAPFRVSVGLSADGSDTPETGGRPARDPIWDWGARAGTTVVLNGGRLSLHGGLSRRIRFPALRELYSGALGRFLVNESLGPERLVVAEIGVTSEGERFNLQVVGFYQRLTDAIVRVSLGDGRYQRQNREVIRSAGVELLGGLGLGRRSVNGDLTLKDVIEDDPDAVERGTHPEYQPAVAGNMALALTLVLGVRAIARLHHLGSRFCADPDELGEIRLAADTWIDLEVNRRFGGRGDSPGLELLFALDNVASSAVFDQCGLPQPGRLLRFQVRVF